MISSEARLSPYLKVQVIDHEQGHLADPQIVVVLMAKKTTYQKVGDLVEKLPFSARRLYLLGRRTRQQSFHGNFKVFLLENFLGI